MANGLRRWAAACMLTAAATALAACGGGGGGTGSVSVSARGGEGGGPAGDVPQSERASARPVDLDPPVTGRELLRLQRVGPEPGAHDLLKYGSDGSAVIVQAYGGGGERIRLCTLHATARRTLHERVRALPLGPRHKAPPHEYVSIYANSPARYTLVSGTTHTSFNDDTMPRDARPIVRLLEDTLYGRAATCQTTYRSRAS